MSSLRLTNHFSACRLISLSKLKAAAEFPARDTNGPYLIAQDGYDPADPAMRRGEYLLSRSGEWLGTHWFVRLPVPERRKDFFFSTVGEVMELMQNLPSQVRVITTRPANVAEETVPDSEFNDLLQPGAGQAPDPTHPMKPNFDPERKIKISVGESGKVEFRLGDVMVVPDAKISLKKDYDPDFTGGFDDKEGALEKVAANVSRLSELQEKLYAQDTYGVLVIFQAIDAAGKDGAIRHVMSGINPQGCHVTSFKAPSSEELDHDYLWRAAKALPQRGMIGIFNRSYYEEVLAVKVHPEYLAKQKLPGKPGGKAFWERRYKEINRFEKYLTANGIVVIKFFLNISKEEQKKRFIARIDEPDKNWKFSVSDYEARARWDDYQQAFEDMLNHTSTKQAPWFVIPSDNKWFARMAISETICTLMEKLDLKFPEVSAETRAELLRIRGQMENE